jgi:hypothetical protein
MNKFRLLGLVGILALGCVACQVQEFPKDLGEAVDLALRKPDAQNIDLVWDHVIEFCKKNIRDSETIGLENADCSMTVIPRKAPTLAHLKKGEFVSDHDRVTFWKEDLVVQESDGQFHVQVLTDANQNCREGLQKFVPTDRPIKGLFAVRGDEVLFNELEVIGFCVGKEKK